MTSPYPPHDPYGQRPQQPYGPPPGYPAYAPPQGRYVRLPGPIAGLDARFVQYLLDLLLMLIPVLALVCLVSGLVLVGAIERVPALLAIGVVLYVVGLLGAIGLQVYLQVFDAHRHGGQTYGMRKRGLRVVKADGSPLTQGDLALRWLMLFLIDGGLVGLICIAATQNKQRLGGADARGAHRSLSPSTARNDVDPRRARE